MSESELARRMRREGEILAGPVTVRLDRIEQAIETMAWRLVQAQTGFGVQDARGIEAILRGEQNTERQPE